MNENIRRTGFKNETSKIIGSSNTKPIAHSWVLPLSNKLTQILSKQTAWTDKVYWQEKSYDSFSKEILLNLQTVRTCHYWLSNGHITTTAAFANFFIAEITINQNIRTKQNQATGNVLLSIWRHSGLQPNLTSSAFIQTVKNLHSTIALMANLYMAEIRTKISKQSRIETFYCRCGVIWVTTKVDIFSFIQTVNEFHSTINLMARIEPRIFGQQPAGLIIRNFYEPCSKCRSPTAI